MTPRCLALPSGTSEVPGVEAVQVQSDSQHEILLPAGLATPHSDGCALDILHLQGHICVEFLCGGESRG